MLAIVSISILIVALVAAIMIAGSLRPIFSEDLAQNRSLREGTNINKSIDSKGLMMPGGNMTFGSSLENARMHILEAMIDLEEGNTKGAIMQLNMTLEGIKTHQKETMEMMKIMKQKTSSGGTENQTS